MAQDLVREPYPLYNTTFTLHRLSPLYTGSNYPLDNSTLQQHARRFRDVLAGDVLRGVRVGLVPEDDVLSRVGALQSVTWQLLAEQDLWNVEDETNLDAVDHEANRGILIQVTYDRASYRAILLRSPREEDHDESMVREKQGREEFQHFPLLLTRMPASLRETFADFLASTFDARVSVLHLSGTYLTTLFENYISDCSMGEDGAIADLPESSRILRKVIKDVQVLIGFDVSAGAPSLQSIQFHVDKEDIPRLVQKGRAIGGQQGKNSPFMDALASFIRAHLALNLRHERVKILRIACGAFVLGAEGRVKLTEPLVVDDRRNVQTRATWTFLNELAEVARGRKLSMGKENP